jgi:inorganic pyrophosphatase
MRGVIVLLTAAVLFGGRAEPPAELPASAVGKLRASLDLASRHTEHVWRDPRPVNADGTVNAYVEIPRGERRKFELDMAANVRVVDRVLPEDIGGYPVNYGFVPQTISYDGDPFDALVLGPPLAGGEFVRGAIVGLMQMKDDKGLDSKVVLSPVDAKGRPTLRLTADDRRRIGEYFDKYKRHQPGAFSEVPGWSTADAGLAFITTTHAFFRECREHVGGACRISE